MRKIAWLMVTIVGFGLACGSTVKDFDDDGASSAGGFSATNGTVVGVGASGATGTVTTTSTAQGGATAVGGQGAGECLVNGESRAMSGDCATACELLWCCAEPRCNGLGPADEAAYLSDCADGCSSNMALIAVVNGADCDSTVSIVRAADANFSDICDNGIQP